MAVASDEVTVRLWRCEVGKRTEMFLTGHNITVSAVAINEEK